MPIANNFIQNASLLEVLVIIILGWTLVPLWQRFIENLSFNTLGLNRDSTYQTFIIALVATVIFLSFTFTFDTIYGNIIESDIGGIIPPVPPKPKSSNLPNESPNSSSNNSSKDLLEDSINVLNSLSMF